MNTHSGPANVATSAPATQTPRHVFPVAGTPLAKVIGDPVHRESFHKRLQSMNKYVVALYRLGVLPVLGAGKNTMILTTRGRTSGRLRRFPVGYFRIAGQFHLLSGWGASANWYKNILAHPDDVSLQIGFRHVAVRANILQDPIEIKRTIETLITESPADAQRLFGWDPQNDHLEVADFSPMIEHVIFVRFTER
jgi:deazaflavin-dependent oxidoreductase (nitroreductase family)